MADNLTDQTPVDNTENPSSAPVQADPPSAKKRLYDKLVKDKLYTKSFDDFDKQFSTQEKVSKLHDFLAKKEQYTKGADMFSAQYFPDVQAKAATKTTPPVNAVPAVQEEPVKKKDHSEPVAAPGSPISGTQLPPFQTEVNQANPPVVAPNSPLLDAQAVAAQATNEHQVKQQQDAVKNPVSSLINDYNTGNVANEHNLGSASLSTNPILQPLQKDAVTKDQYDKAGGNLLYDPEAQQKADAWEKAHPGQKMPSYPEDQATVTTGHIPTFADKFKNNVMGFDSDVIKGVGDLKSLAGDMETMTDKVLAKAGVMDKGTAANFQQNTKNSQAQFDREANLGYAENYLNNSPVSGIGRMVPMLIGGGSYGAQIAAMQAWGSTTQMIDKLKAQGVKFENGSDLLLKGGSALINYALMKDVIGTTLLKSMGQETFNGFVGAAAADATKELAEKGADATAQDYANYYLIKAGQLSERAGALGIGAVKTFAKVGTDFAAANVAGTMLKATVNAMNKKPPLPAVTGDEVVNDVSSPFYNGDTPAKGSITQFIKNLVTSPAAAFSALHAAQSAGMLFKNSPYINPVISDLQKDQSPENIQRIKDQLGKYGESNGWSPDNIQQTYAKIDELADLATKIPNNIEPAKFNTAINLVMDRRHMEGVLQEAQARKSGLDPALQGAASKFENWLSAQVDQANDRLNYLVTDKPWTYFEHQGEYFKVQQDSDPVKITKDRYDLEGVNNKRESLSDGSIVMEPGEADKKGNPIPEKDGEKENKGTPAKAAVPKEPAKQEPAKPEPEPNKPEPEKSVPAKAENTTPTPTGGSGDKVAKEVTDIDRAIIPKSETNTVRMHRDVKTRADFGGKENEFYIPESIARAAYADYAKGQGADVQSYDEIIRRGGFSPAELDKHVPNWRQLIKDNAKPSVTLKSTQDADPEFVEKRKNIVNAIDQVSKEKNLSEGVKNALKYHFGFSPNGGYFVAQPIDSYTTKTSPERLKKFAIDAGASVLRDKYGENSKEYSNAIDELHNNVSTYVQAMLDGHMKNTSVGENKTLTSVFQTVFDVLNKLQDNAKPESPEAVTPNKDDHGKNETETQTKEKGVSTEEVKPEKTGETDKTPVFSNEDEADRHWIQHETDPEAIASYYHQQNFNAENVADYKEHRINEYLGNTKINANDFSRFGDDNLLQGDPALRRRIDKTNSQLPIDTQAQELSDDNFEVSPQDIVDFITKYKNPEDFKEQSKTQIQKDLADKYAELTGTSLTSKRAEDAFNKQQEIHKQAKMSDDAREIIDREGITPANIDKLESMFRGFPYSDEDFDNVKRYLDEHAKTEKPKSGATTASPGAKSAGVGETEQKPTAEPKPRKETAKPGELTPEQQKVADDYNKKIGVAIDDLVKAQQKVEKKLAELSNRNNLFGDDNVAQKSAQQSLLDTKLDMSDDNVKAIMDPLHAEVEKLTAELAELQRQRETAIRNTHAQTNAFESPTDDGQVTAAKNAVKSGTDLVAKRNAHPDGGSSEGVKKIKAVLGDKDKKAVDDIRKRIREKLNGPDPMQDMSYSEDDEDELFTDGIKLTKLYFKSGIRAFPEFAGIMIEDMGESVVPFLKSFYEGAKNLPGMVSSEYDSTDTVDYHIAKLNEVADPVETFIDRVKAEINAGSKLNITHLEGMASEAGLATDVRTHLQEYVERALIELAREAMDNPLYDDRDKFNELVDLYNKQPALHQRSSTKVLLQQYSTPLPYAYSAGLYVDGIKPGRVYDPTAGTGNLLIAFDPDKTVTNEIDPLRVKILQQLGYNPTDKDASIVNFLTEYVQGVVSNPPFGPANKTQKYHDYSFDKLDYIVPLNALLSMKDGGRASIIIGGHNEYDAKGGLKGGDFKFLNYLHHYYNVTDVINVDGNLYAKQGTTFPTRLILINGRKEVPQDYAPAYDAERDKPVKTFEDLFNRIQERIKQDENPTVLQSRVDVQPDFGRNNDGDGAGQVPAKDTGRSGTVSGTTPDEPNRRSVEGEGAGRAGIGGQTQPGNQLDLTIGDSEGDHTGGELAVVPDEVAKYAEAAEAGSIGPEGAGELVPRDRPVSVNRPSADELVNNEKVTYTPASRLTEAGSVIPSNMAYETEQNLRDIENLYGRIDSFVANELGYHDLDDLNNAFFAEQVDAIAMAIHQLKQGKGMIIGDMTGIGKGRIAAGLIRWAVNQGEVPTFFTENSDLFSDIYRDLYGIGSGHLVPFIVNDPSSDRDANIKKGGRIVYKAGTIKDKRQFFEKGKLPHGTKVVLCTYSQLNSEKQTLKRGFISNHTRDGYMFLDESHNVAGDSKSGKFFHDLLQQAKGAAFFSATYAKRADNMPVYAMKTSMQDAGLTNEALVEAIQSGGNAMQEIIASQLVKSGQMIRRERDFTGVENTFTTMGVGKDGKPDELGIKHRELADQVINVCNAIIDFERTHVVPAMEDMEAILRKNGQKISQTKSKGLSVANTPFASKMFNIVNQMLFSIKAPELANEAIRQLKEHGRKPVITFHSTMESFLKNGGYKPGDHVEDVSFSASLMKGLENTLKYRIEHPNGEKEVGRFDLEDLGEDAKNSWNEVVKQIKAASTDMSISPIDTITDILTKAGLSVGEVTGRSMKLVFNDDHSAAEVEGIPSRDTAGIIHDFNNGGGGGKADVILLNAAGATGFSLHADKSFKDQRQRVMINGQFKLDINKEIQTRGRIDRTNQVKRGKYIYLTTSIPAETRLAMMVSDKLKKLQANTAGDQKDKKNEMEVTDFLNEYGDQVMTDYLAANPAIYDQLFHGKDPAGIKDLKPGQSAKPVEGIASKATGRAALLNVKEQEAFYNAVSQDYNDYVDYLNSTNQNTMAVKSVNLEAKVLSKGVFVEGKHTQSPFGQDSMLEKVEANVLRKPLTKEELESEIADALDGKSPAEAAKALIDGVREFYANALKRSLERYQENYDKRDAKDLRANVGNPELYKAAKAQNDEQMQKNVEYATNENSAAEGKMSSLFRDYRVGSEHMVPTSITGAETKYTKGIFLGFHFKEKHNHNPYTPSNVLMKFAVLDGSRTITVAASRSEFINALYAGKAQLSRSELEQMGKMRENWEETVKNTKAREPRFIVTGNILQAFRPNMGHLISYTTDKGAIEKGILMPKDFNAAQNGKSVGAVAMYDKIMAMHIDGDPIISSDGNVEIHKEASRSFSIRVPKSTKTGGKYFKNEALLAVVNFGEFHTYAGKMEATVESYRVMDMLKVLEKEFNLKFNTGIDLQESMEPQSDDHRTGSKVSKSVPLKPRDSGELKPSEPSEKPSEPSGDEHSFVDAKSTERIQAATYMPVTHDGEPIPLKKLPDMISDLAKGLNVKMYYAASKRKNAAGSYSPSTGGIKLGIVNNLDVTIHEVGHALDDRYLLFDTIPAADNAAIMTELQWFADRGGSNPPAGASAAQKAEYLKREGIAEFTRAWVINRNEALARAPKFFAHFENTIPEDVLDVLHEFGGDYLRYINGTALDNIMANIEEVPKEQRPAYRRFIESVFGKHGEFHLTPFDKLQVRLSNSGHAFNESYKYILNLAGGDIKSTVPGENARDLALLFAGVDGKIGSFFDNGIVNGKNEPIIDGRTGQRMNLEWLLGSFDSTSVESLKQDQALSIAYMVSERTIEKAMQFDRQNDISGISAAGDQTDTDIAIKFLTKEFGRDMPREQKIRIMEGARRYQLWSDKMLRYMVDKGRLSESNYRDIKEKNLAYVAFLPVQENAPGEEMTFDNISNLTKSAAVGNVKNVIKEMTGSTMHKRHPYISLMQNTASMIKEADRNEILQSYIEPMVNTIRAMGDGKVNPFADIMMEVGPVEKSQGKPVISVYLNGHAKFYMFSPEAKDVYDYIRGLTNLPQLPGIATAIPRLLRWTATRSPVFAKNHLIRSTFNRLIISRTGSGLGDFIKGKRDNEDELYALFGGSQNGYWLGNRIDYYKLQNQLIKEMAGKGNTVVINPGEMAKKFYKGYMDLIHQSDVVNRTAEFRSAYKKAITPKHQGGLGFDEYNANLYAAMQSKDLLNASVAGTWMRVFNQFIPFSNVEIQGLKRNIKAAIESGDLRGLGLWAIRMVLYILLPTLFTRLLAHIGGYEEEYDNLPAYQRDLGWNFKVPGQESWFYAPKPYDSGLLGAGMDRMIGGFGKNNENAWYGFDKTVFQSLFLMKPEMAVGPLADVVEPMTNYSFFKQGPIVPRYEEDKLLALRHNFNTASRLGKGISVLSSPFFKQGDAIDPRYVDEIMQTTFSYYGDWAMSLSDIGSKESRHKFGWRTTGFIKEQQIAGDARVEKLYGVAKELGLTSSRPIKALSGLIREYYDATQPSDRKSLHEQIMGLAKDTYKSWMADDIYKEKIESKGKEINFN